MADNPYAAVADPAPAQQANPYLDVAEPAAPEPTPGLGSKALALSAEQQEQAYGKVEAYTPTISERMDRITGHLFTSGPKQQGGLTPGVRPEWSDVPDR